MGNVRYKEISSELEASASPILQNRSRISIGNNVNVGEIFYLLLEDLLPSPIQARKKFDEEALKRLAETISSVGITAPLSVVSSLEEKGKFEIISGERRFRAAKICGLKKVPCMILEDKNTLDEIALIENIQRDDLHPIELADALYRLSKTWKTSREIAKKIGKTESTVSELLAFSKLPKEIKEHLINGQIQTRSILRKLSSMTSISEMRDYLKISREGKISFNKSVLRISLEGTSFKIQASKLSALSSEERGKLKKELLQIVDSL